ncbi:hypothetical protein BCR34DRAFT_586151 [Clohesyomyces aquaticus]|uniref:Uncharacterized protein n=1 Tax=Clohesyomyces aquaticus TaxID=1231657 RepID=A0A1Y1ZUN9_9PLEO|nr:hypothetical protein BCR34DRAFT_586151 [Clohesyomyces aquaticus]
MLSPSFTSHTAAFLAGFKLRLSLYPGLTDREIWKYATKPWGRNQVEQSQAAILMRLRRGGGSASLRRARNYEEHETEQGWRERQPSNVPEIPRMYEPDREGRASGKDERLECIGGDEYRGKAVLELPVTYEQTDADSTPLILVPGGALGVRHPSASTQDHQSSVAPFSVPGIDCSEFHNPPRQMPTSKLLSGDDRKSRWQPRRQAAALYDPLRKFVQKQVTDDDAQSPKHLFEWLSLATVPTQHGDEEFAPIPGLERDSGGVHVDTWPPPAYNMRTESLKTSTTP